MKNVKSILWGIFLILMGVLIGIDAFNLFGIDINFFFDGWWTLIIIIPCAIDMFKGRDKTLDIIGILIGVILLLTSRDILKFEDLLKLILPLGFIIIGFTLLLKNRKGGKIAREIKKINENGLPRQEVGATFSKENLNLDNQVLQSMDLSASFGKLNCNFQNTTVNTDIVLNVNASFGSVEIIAPKDVKVVVKSSSMFGGVSNKTESSKQNNELPKIYVNAVCMFGGVDVI